MIGGQSDVLARIDIR